MGFEGGGIQLPELSEEEKQNIREQDKEMGYPSVSGKEAEDKQRAEDVVAANADMKDGSKLKNTPIGYEPFPSMKEAEEKQRAEDVAAANADMKKMPRLDSFPKPAEEVVKAAETSAAEDKDTSREERIARYKGLREEAEVLKREFKEKNGFDLDLMVVSERELQRAEDFLAKAESWPAKEKVGYIYENAVADSKKYVERTKAVLEAEPKLQEIRDKMREMEEGTRY